MSPVVLGRKDWRFTGSLRVGQRAAPVMNLIQSALLNVHGPYTYLSEGGGLKHQPTTRHKDMEELLSHNRWPVQD